MKRCSICDEGNLQYASPPVLTHQSQKHQAGGYSTISKFVPFAGSSMSLSLCGLHVISEARRLLGPWWEEEN